MERFKLTVEQLKKARTYMTAAEKEAFIRSNAVKCFDRLRLVSGDGKDPMPPMYRENPVLKARYLMTALVRDYLGIPCETVLEADGTGDLMSEGDYDRYAGSNLFGQLIAWRRDAGMKSICGDLMSDYSLLERWFSSQVRSLLDIQNDAVVRQSELDRQAVQQLPALLEELKKLAPDRSGKSVMQDAG